MISYDEVYKQAIIVFDDPDLTFAYDQNKIYFFKLMYPFLNASSSLFTQPFAICELLSDRTEPVGTMETFVSDGATTTYDLSFTPMDNSVFEYRGDGVVISGQYDSEANSITFDQIIDEGKQYSFEAYFPGSFNSKLAVTGKKTLDATIRNQVVSILARMLAKAWAEDKRNFLLDVQNILRDPEFTLHPASAALRSKDQWIASLDQEISQYQNKLSHNIRFASNSNWVRRYN